MKVRKLREGETPPLDLLLLADPSEHLIREYLEMGICYIVEDGTRIIGVYVLLPMEKETIELINLAVVESYQGNGLGKRLVMHAIEEARKLGYKKIEVGTGNSSISQLALYQKCGFRINRIEKDFFLQHYEEEIYENGIQCIDMIKLTQDV